MSHCSDVITLYLNEIRCDYRELTLSKLRNNKRNREKERQIEKERDARTHEEERKKELEANDIKKS
jgi:hypothetical protein